MLNMIIAFLGDWWWLLVALPLATLSGWVAAMHGGAVRHQFGSDHLPEAWRGLNFLLNEQPDKAIEVFVNGVDVRPDTVEMHLIVGALFRRRGEVERAIRIHQNLLSSNHLKRRHRIEVLYALGQDYLKAGFLGRAEDLFLELVNSGQRARASRKHLIRIYELEKEWEKAIDMARGTGRTHSADSDAVIAHYYCELAERAFTDGRLEICREKVQEALATDRNCVRATILAGRIEAFYGNHAAAVRIWHGIEEQDIRYVGEIVHLISGSYIALNDEEGLDDYLKRSLDRHHHVCLMVAAAERIEAQQGHHKAVRFLADRLREQPSLEGLARFLDLRIRHATDEGVRRDLGLLHSMISGVLKKERNYACGNCGYTGSSLYWQCPRCKSWGSLQPRSGFAHIDEAPEYDAIPEGLVVGRDSDDPLIARNL